MSWASQFIKHNRDFAGNLLKNAAPAAFLIPGIGPGAAAAIGGLGSALGRGIQHGANLGNIAKQGISGASIAYGGAQGMGALKSAFAPSSSAAGAVAGAPTTAVGNGTMVSNGNGAWLPAGGAGASDSAASAGSSLMSKLGSGAQAVGKFTKDYPNAIAAGLQGLGAIGTMGTENAMRRAQTNSINQQTAMSQQEAELLKRRQAALQPLMQALMGQQYQSARNPYS